MQRLLPEANFKSIPNALLALGCVYFLYEATLQYLLPFWPPGISEFSPARQATLLREARSQALGFMWLMASFLLMAAWGPLFVRIFLLALLVTKAVFFVLWYSPGPIELTIVYTAIPFVLLAGLVRLAFRYRRVQGTAP